jgi:hypothetical protein
LPGAVQWIPVCRVRLNASDYFFLAAFFAAFLAAFLVAFFIDLFSVTSEFAITRDRIVISL